MTAGQGRGDLASHSPLVSAIRLTARKIKRGRWAQRGTGQMVLGTDKRLASGFHRLTACLLQRTLSYCPSFCLKLFFS
jgi:hypothetical protein